MIPPAPWSEEVESGDVLSVRDADGNVVCWIPTDDWSQAIETARAICAGPRLAALCRELDAIWRKEIGGPENAGRYFTVEGVGFWNQLRSALAAYDNEPEPTHDPL